MIDFTAMSLKQIKEKLEEYGPYVPEELLEALRKDGRAGAKKRGRGNRTAESGERQRSAALSRAWRL